MLSETIVLVKTQRMVVSRILCDFLIGYRKCLIKVSVGKWNDKQKNAEHMRRENSEGDMSFRFQGRDKGS